MSDKLQALLDRINEEGFKKADAECTGLLNEAKAQAKATLEEAQKEAETIRNRAKQDADLLQQKAEQALRHAARDVILSLRSQLEERMKRVATELVAETCTPEALTEILSSLVEKFVDSQGRETRLEVLLNEKDLATVDAALKARLGKELQENCVLSPTPEVTSGFRLKMAPDDDIVYDFSDAALGDALATLLNPKFAALLTPEAKPD